MEGVGKGAIKRMNRHLKKSCEDDLEQFANKKDIYISEWGEIINKVNNLDSIQDFEAISKLKEYMNQISTNVGDSAIKHGYNKVEDSLQKVGIVLTYGDD